MAKRESALRCHKIIEKLRVAPATWKSIDEHLQAFGGMQGFALTTTKRTFNRDVIEILQVYGICIEYNRSRGVYFIDDAGQPQLTDRILEAFDTFNALSVTDGLATCIHFEQRKSLGTENMYGLLHAIKNQLQVQFTYHKYWEVSVTVRTVEPLALKEFNNRWYLIARKPGEEKIKCFALDRLTELVLTRLPNLNRQTFNIGEHYRYCFGIISPDTDAPEEIVLSFNAFQGKYIKSMPLHSTQEVLVDNKIELQVKLKLFVTADLVMELLSFGANMKVLQPASLAEKIKTAQVEAARQYES